MGQRKEDGRQRRIKGWKASSYKGKLVFKKIIGGEMDERAVENRAVNSTCLHKWHIVISLVSLSSSVKFCFDRQPLVTPKEEKGLCSTSESMSEQIRQPEHIEGNNQQR